jgi:hypothetical protein
VSGEAWFSTLGEPLDEAERAEIAAYLSGLSLHAAVHAVSTWKEAADICAHPANAWWDAEEREKRRLEEKAAYQARLARAAGAPVGHPFLRKYALYCGGRWPLGVYEGRFAIF